MDEKQSQALANELTKNIKTPDDLSQFERLLKKISVGAALNAEMTRHPGDDKNQPELATNARNGHTQKTVITGDGPKKVIANIGRKIFQRPPATIYGSTEKRMKLVFRK
ncbi:transposase, Mutator family protein [Erwinia tracheiphila PSU-1]|nr:transposase, Mutator family protein [Erwinia tracheiphila PSU-1]